MPSSDVGGISRSKRNEQNFSNEKPRISASVDSVISPFILRLNFHRTRFLQKARFWACVLSNNPFCPFMIETVHVLGHIKQRIWFIFVFDGQKFSCHFQNVSEVFRRLPIRHKGT
jgi:hypothetical protein